MVTKINKLTETRYGQMLYNTNDSVIGKNLEVYGEWYEAEMELLRNFIKPGDICIDVGANIGCHTLFFASIVGKTGLVISYEPQPQIFQLLSANASLNDYLNVQTFNAAVGNHDGFARIPPIDYTQEGNYGIVSLSDVGIPIPIYKLDSMPTTRLNLIKIDVEGYECEVIKGARNAIRKHRPFLYIENNKPEKSLELINLVKSLKYSCYDHNVVGFNPNNFKNYQTDIHGGYIEKNLLAIPQEQNIYINLPKL